MTIKFDHRTLLGIKQAGEYTDPLTKGLKLRVTDSKSGAGVAKSWAFRYQVPGTTNRTYIGLGSFPEVGIAEAREAARQCAESVRSGIDPKDARTTNERALAAAATKKQTFKDVAREYWMTHKGSWKNKKHRAQWWDSWMETYTNPHIGKMNVADIKLDDVVNALKPVWLKIPDTAKKIRGAIGSVLDYAVAHKLRSEDVNNPCRQLKQLQARLGKHKGSREHQPALDYQELRQFYKDLLACSSNARRSVSYLALEFAVITGLRANCVAELRFDEIDTKKKIALIPASKMKAGKAFALPLNERALKIIAERKQVTDGSGYVFGVRDNEPMSEGAMLECLKTICGVKGIKSTDKAYKPKYIDPVSKRRITVHGFRATLTSWAEDNGYSRELCDATIQHSKGDSNIQAYARGEQFKLRKELLDAYWSFITG